MYTLLIDGDLITYRYAFGAQTNHYFLEAGNKRFNFDPSLSLGQIKQLEPIKDTSYEIQNEPTAVSPKLVNSFVNEFILSLLDQFKTTKYKIYLSPPTESLFRSRITSEYKAHRKHLKKPILYESIRKYLIEEHGAEVGVDQEADDCIGIAANENTIIVTIDKDLRMIPGLYYNFVTKTLYTISELGQLTLENNKLTGDGLKWFYAQLLLGDPTDNIKGIHGFGPKKTYKLLNSCLDMNDLLKVVTIEYMRTYKTDFEEALRNTIDLVWIRRKSHEYKSDELMQIVKTLMSEIEYELTKTQ